MMQRIIIFSLVWQERPEKLPSNKWKLRNVTASLVKETIYSISQVGQKDFHSWICLNGATIRRELNIYRWQGVGFWLTRLYSTACFCWAQDWIFHYQRNMFPAMDMGDGKAIRFVQWTVRTASKSSNTMLPLIPWCQSVSWNPVWCTVMKNLVLWLILQRVREMSLSSDGHLFVTPEQIQKNSNAPFSWLHRCLWRFQREWIPRLSLHNPEDKEKYFDNDQMWGKMPEALRAAHARWNGCWLLKPSEAAFYGPKLDISNSW